VDIEKLLRHRPFVRALARRLVRDDARAEDLVQETYLTALKSPPKHDGALRAWLAAVVRNLARTQNRAEWRRTKHERKQPEDGGRVEPRALPSAEATLERATWHQRLVEATMQLDEPYRSTLLLRYFEELDATEIGKIQGVPAATVRTRLRRGIERLRSELDQKTPGGRATWVPALLILARPPRGIGIPAAEGTKSAAGFPGALLTAAAAAVVLVSVAVWSIYSAATSVDRNADRADESRASIAVDSPGPIGSEEPVPIQHPRAGHQLEVRVLDQGRPADGATVVVSSTPDHPWSVVPRGAWQAAGRAVTDRNGMAQFGGLASGYVRVAAWRSGSARALEFVWLPQKLAYPIVIDLLAQERHALLVTSVATGEPIEDARVWIEEKGGGLREPGPDQTRTGPDGVAELNGLGPHSEARLTVGAQGFESMRASATMPTLALEPADRVVRWPVALERRPSAFALVRPHGGEPVPALWSDGIVEVGSLPLAGWPEHWLILPDGRFARLEAERGRLQGTPLHFAEPVRLAVTLRDTSGNPVEGVRLRVADAASGTHLFEPRESWTDAAGQALLPVYARDAVHVLYRELTGTQWRPLRTFDPDGGDAGIELRLPVARTLRIRIRNATERLQDGEWALHLDRERLAPVRWQDGSWTVSVRQWSSEGRAVLHFLSRGVEPVSRSFERGNGDAELEWDLEWKPASELAVHVRRAREAQPFRLALVGESEQRGPGRYLLEVGPDGVVRDATVPAGTHRLLDLVSGKVSEPFMALAGSSVRVTFDLSDVDHDWPVLRGQLVAPSGFDFASVTMEARPGGRIPVERAGGFVVPWPEKGGVELIVESEAGVARQTFVATPDEYLRLPVAPSASGRFELPAAVAAGATRPRVVARSADGRVITVEAEVVGRTLRFDRLAPGRWSLTLDLPGFAPSAVTDVQLDPGANDLGSLSLSRGASLRFQIQPRPGTLAPELGVAAQALDEFRYQRSVFTSGEAQFGLSGLGAGRFRVTAWNVHTGLPLWSGEIVSDGSSDREITIALD